MLCSPASLALPLPARPLTRCSGARRMVNIGPERPCSNPSCRNPVHDAQAIKVPGSIDNWVHSKWDAQKCRLAVGIPKLSWSKRQRVEEEQPAAEAEQPQPQAVAVGHPYRYR